MAGKVSYGTFGCVRLSFVAASFGRCVGLGSGVLWCVSLIYGEAGLVSRELVSHGTVG